MLLMSTLLQEYRIAYRASLFSRSVPEWNHLHIRNASSVDSFKSSLTRDHDINDLISKSHYYD